MTPHEKQVMMFSATLSKDVRPVCKKFMQDVSWCERRRDQLSWSSREGSSRRCRVAPRQSVDRLLMSSLSYSPSVLHQYFGLPLLLVESHNLWIVEVVQ